MRLLSRRDRPPADVVAQLDPGERVVSWADGVDAAFVVATPRGLLWPGPDGYRRIGWQYINKAVWHEGVLSIIEAEVVDDLLLRDRPALALSLTVARDLPPTVRKRIDANVVHTELHPVPGGAARFVARRIPGRDGLVWWARLEPGVPDSDAVRVAVAAQIAALTSAHAVPD